MAKIPRLDGGSISAPVPSGSITGTQGGAVPIIDAAGKMGEAAYKVAADAELVEANKRQQAIEAKQAIVNEVEAGRRAGDFEETLVYEIEALKEKFADNPSEAPAVLLESARLLQDKTVGSASNSVVGLAVAQRANSRLDEAMEEIHRWVQLRQTQKARGDLTITVNRATAAAEGQSSVPALSQFIAVKSAELLPTFAKVYGASAKEELVKMQTGMARAWAAVAGDRDPISVLAALDSKEEGNPLVDYLDGKEREALRRETKASFEGITRNRELDVIKKGLNDNRELFNAFMEGNPNLGGTFYAQKRAIEEARAAVTAQLSLDSKALKDIGIEVQGQTDKDLLKIFDAREEFVTTLERARRRQISFVAEDDPSAVEGLLSAQDKALKARRGKDLGAIVEQQARLAAAFSDKKISQSTFSTMFKTLSLALDTAAEKGEDPRGWNWWLARKYPDVAGNMALNESSDFKGLDKAAQNRVRLAFMSQFVDSQERGEAIDGTKARKMALRALSMETGERLPGVD